MFGNFSELFPMPEMRSSWPNKTQGQYLERADFLFLGEQRSQLIADPFFDLPLIGKRNERKPHFNSDH